jgi:hypothetical protein
LDTDELGRETSTSLVSYSVLSNRGLNEALKLSPSLYQKRPFADLWLFKVRPLSSKR